MNWTDDDARSIDFRKILRTISSLAFNTLPFRIIGPFIKLYVSGMDKTGLPGQMEALLAHDTLAGLPTIQAPTLVIRGTKDRLINPSSSEVIAAAIASAELDKVEGGSHAFFVEQRGEFNKKVLAFLLRP